MSHLQSAAFKILTLLEFGCSAPSVQCIVVEVHNSRMDKSRILKLGGGVVHRARYTPCVRDHCRSLKDQGYKVT